jgi:aspartate/tyrosine/aromatic aminotransferase
VQEVEAMRLRIRNVRRQLVEGLAARETGADFSFIERQNGMFSFSGLNDDQVRFLREEKGIYLVKGGRLNVAGLNTGNLAYVCDAIAESLKA